MYYSPILESTPVSPERSGRKATNNGCGQLTQQTQAHIPRRVKQPSPERRTRRICELRDPRRDVPWRPTLKNTISQQGSPLMQGG
ncbi:hypothetical protein J6590_019042 [Homalodisca vitripennis]|nr:hypothetical protein J6590_019042 [Homalodisca vitripennis]